MAGEKYNEYKENNPESKKEEIDAAITHAQLDLNKLQSAIIQCDKKTTFTTPDPVDSINNFYSIEGNKTIVFNLNQVKNYLNAVNKRLSGMQVQKFGEISKENNFTGTILAIQIALKAIDSKKYNIGKINGEYSETTKQAIKQFQTDKKLKRQDGKPGKETIGKLIESLGDSINNKRLEFSEQKTLKKDVSDIIEESCRNNPYSGAYTPKKKEEIVNYIVEGNLKSGKNQLIEMQITSLSQDAASQDFTKNWKLKYLIEHSNEPLKTNIQSIKKINGNGGDKETKNNANSFYGVKLDTHKAYSVEGVSSKPQGKTNSGAFKNCRLTKRLGRVGLDTTIIEHNGVRINRSKYHEETYYSQKVLPGGGLEKFKGLKGRHVAEDGTVRDGDGYIVVAANLNYAPRDSIVMTSLGPGKVYDTGDLPKGRFDIYVNR